MASAARLQKIFVGNLPWSVGHAELRDFFRQFGRVTSANVTYDRNTGCSKGYGFVMFANDRDDKVLQRLESKDQLFLEGHHLTIQPVDEYIAP